MPQVRAYRTLGQFARRLLRAGQRGPFESEPRRISDSIVSVEFRGANLSRRQTNRPTLHSSHATEQKTVIAKTAIEGLTPAEAASASSCGDGASSCEPVSAATRSAGAWLSVRRATVRLSWIDR